MVVLLLVFVLLALIVLPTGYILLCRKMRKEGVPNPPTLSLFFAFGTFGGFCAMIALSIPLGLFCLPLVFLSSMLSFFAALRLYLRRKGPSQYHDIAMGTGFVASLPFIWFGGMLCLGLLGVFGHH